MKNTTNYNLSLYEASDKFCITSPSNSFNQNMEIIDNEIHKVSIIANQALNKEISIDETLSISGQAADAKIIGDKILDLQQEISALKEIIKNMQTDRAEK